MKNKIWIISEPYYPEETATGYIMTKIAEGLTRHYSVSVLCSQPTYRQRGHHSPRFEVRNKVAIYRCPGSTLDKDRLVFRLINIVTMSLSIFFAALFKIKRNELVIVVTVPPTMIFVIWLVCWLHRAKCILLVHDVYPEALIVTGLTKSGSVLSRTLEWFTRNVYRHMSAIVTIGRDMQRLISDKTSSCQTRVALITNWADIEQVRPFSRDKNALLTRLGLIDNFVIQYSGNMGLTHGIESLFQAAKDLAKESIYHFLFIGSGAKKEWLTSQVQRNGLTNVTMLPMQQRDDKLTDVLNACDVAIISFIPGMAGVSVPSRLYNFMAAGKPIIAIADEDSELALVVKEEEIGWVLPPGDVEKILTTVRAAKSDPSLLAEMGKRARHAAEQKYSLDNIINDYISLMHEMGMESRH